MEQYGLNFSKKKKKIVKAISGEKIDRSSFVFVILKASSMKTKYLQIYAKNFCLCWKRLF